ncbi:hypothetical protein QAD02_012354 [Eretmocerus hayati]|uniref:Uncharacterized protein n=1 Tax=Eretmocerus hayati TaxID=131215 RepID=A0ACC2NZM6_9HYME|nr:hypothetical protein QAD02_012354 [Eretmocerus hayati]
MPTIRSHIMDIVVCVVTLILEKTGKDEGSDDRINNRGRSNIIIYETLCSVAGYNQEIYVLKRFENKEQSPELILLKKLGIHCNWLKMRRTLFHTQPIPQG